MKARSVFCIVLFLISGSAVSGQETHQLDSLKTFLASDPDKVKYAEALKEIAYAYEDQGDLKNAREYLLKAIDYCEKKGLITKLIDGQIDLSQNYRMDEQMKDEEKHIVIAEKMATQINDSSGLARVYFVWGEYYKDLGNWNLAIENTLRSIRYYEGLHEQYQIISVYSMLGNLYRKTNSFNKAQEYYQKAFVSDSTQNLVEFLGTDYTNLGLIYSDLKNYPRAISYLEKAIELKKEQGNPASVATTISILGSVYVDIGQYDKGLKLMFEALQIKEKAGEMKGISIACLNIGDVYKEQKKYPEAILYYKKSVGAARKIKNIDVIKEDYKGLAFAYKETNDLSNAFSYHVLYSDLKDSMYNEENSKQINDMQTKYETEKKEKENAVLQAQNASSEQTIKQQKLISYFIAAGLLLSLALAYFIFRGFKQKQKANEIIAEKNREIMDSIHYAKRIQRALLPTEKYIEKSLKRLKK
jgi:tetratricopeptide (TPR) repeat protein